MGDNFEERRAGEWAKFTALLAIKAAARAAGDDGCQMAIAKLLDFKGLALRACGQFHKIRYAAKRQLLLSRSRILSLM